MPAAHPSDPPLDDPPVPQRIGLLSDSHGEFGFVDRAIGLLRREGAECIVHLGDFLDSAKNDSRQRVIDLLRRNNITAIKGNNEIQIESTLQSAVGAGAGDKSAGPGIIGYLSGLRAETAIGDLCFVHTMPSRYLLSLYEPIDRGNTDKALQILLDTPHRIIFSGHSHAPAMFELHGGKIKRQAIQPGSRHRLHPDAKYIIIVGSSEAGICGLFERSRMLYRCVRIGP